MLPEKDKETIYDDILSKDLEDEVKSQKLEISDKNEIERWKKTKVSIFILILIVIISIDIIYLPSSQNLSAPIIIGFFELILLSIISRYLEIADFSVLIDKILESYGNNK